ncbi:hypothetical protein D3C87_1827240 [compost metagenome]
MREADHKIAMLVISERRGDFVGFGYRIEVNRFQVILFIDQAFQLNAYPEHTDFQPLFFENLIRQRLTFQPCVIKIIITD